MCCFNFLRPIRRYPILLSPPMAAAYTVADWINLITPLLNDPAVTLHKEL